MASGPTLNSRLRVLVAKTFRAEKLYSSMRNSSAGRLSSTTALTELANDIRAREWQRSHFQLRTALNDILSAGGNSALGSEIATLRQRFVKKSTENSELLARGSDTLQHTAKRQEFAHVFKLSIDLVRYKAAAQANQVIADELAAILESSGRSLKSHPAAEGDAAEAAERGDLASEVEAIANSVEAAEEVARIVDGEKEATSGYEAALMDRQQPAEGSSNVIPLKRRFGGIRRARS